MKLPRNVSGRALQTSLRRLGYAAARQRGSHVRITTQRDGEHHEVIPVDDPIRVNSPWQKSAAGIDTTALLLYTGGMAMGTTRDDGSQQSMWVSATDLPQGGGHPFYEMLNRIFEAAGFDAFVEGLCPRFYATKTGRPSLAPGRYFRLLLIGYFEVDLAAVGVRSHIADPDRGRRNWKDREEARDAVYANRRRVRGRRGRRLQRRRGEMVERPFAAPVRDGWDAAGVPAGSSEHPEAPAGARRGPQPRAAPAPVDRRRHAPGPAGPGRRRRSGADLAACGPPERSGTAPDTIPARFGAGSPRCRAAGLFNRPSEHRGLLPRTANPARKEARCPTDLRSTSVAM